MIDDPPLFNKEVYLSSYCQWYTGNTSLVVILKPSPARILSKFCIKKANILAQGGLIHCPYKNRPAETPEEMSI